LFLVLALQTQPLALIVKEQYHVLHQLLVGTKQEHQWACALAPLNSTSNKEAVWMHKSTRLKAGAVAYAPPNLVRSIRAQTTSISAEAATGQAPAACALMQHLAVQKAIPLQLHGLPVLPQPPPDPPDLMVRTSFLHALLDCCMLLGDLPCTGTQAGGRYCRGTHHANGRQERVMEDAAETADSYLARLGVEHKQSHRHGMMWHGMARQCNAGHGKARYKVPWGMSHGKARSQRLNKKTGCSL
jgi:hypothetical protein